MRSQIFKNRNENVIVYYDRGFFGEPSSEHSLASNISMAVFSSNANSLILLNDSRKLAISEELLTFVFPSTL